MKNICFISGSPRGKASTSEYLLDELNKFIDDKEYNKFFIDARQSINKKTLEDDFQSMIKADAIVIAFPLYIYCLPGVLGRFLEEYYDFAKNNEELNKKVKVYTIVNCGFPEPEINSDAVRVIKNFSNRLGLNWRFGLQIGMGGMLQGIKDIEFMKKIQGEIYKGFKEIKEDMDSEDKEKRENLCAKIKFPKALYLSIGGKEWNKTAKSNGLREEDLYKKPYVQ